jgi:hypothetical protein
MSDETHVNLPPFLESIRSTQTGNALEEVELILAAASKAQLRLVKKVVRDRIRLSIENTYSALK